MFSGYVMSKGVEVLNRYIGHAACWMNVRSGFIPSRSKEVISFPKDPSRLWSLPSALLIRYWCAILRLLNGR